MIQDSGQAKGRPALRLFTGIAAPTEINLRLDELVRRLRPLARIRWSPASNFHITTKFIGAWPEDRLHDLKAALAGVTGGGIFKIAIRGLGFFPNARSPRIFWAGIEGGAALANLASRTDQVCAHLGIEPEKKPYAPHLTLARIDAPSQLASLHEALAKLPTTEFGAFDATAFHLYLSQTGLSQTGRGGSIYTSLAEFPL